MKTLFCKNKRRSSEGKLFECGGFLGSLTDAQVEMLRVDPEGKAEFRCHSCPAEMRWITVVGERGELVYKPGPDRQKFYKEPEYDKVLICEQGG
jgi:hypothetical protein